MRILLASAFILAALLSAGGAIQNSQQPQSPDFVKSTELNSAAVKLFNEAKYDEALPLETQALELREKAVGPNDAELIPILKNLGEIHKSMARSQESAASFERALKLAEKAYGPNDIRLTPILDPLAVVEYRLKHATNAESLFAKSLKIKEAKLGPQDTEIAETAFNLGQVYAARANYKAASPMFSRAIAIWETGGVPQRAKLVKALENQVLVLTGLGKNAEADKAQNRIAELSTSAPGRVVDFGVLNGKALALVTPAYPEAARIDRAQGEVRVQVMIDAIGRVISAKALNPGAVHQTLVFAAENAARKCRFSPTLVAGQPVQVRGIIIFNFVRQ